ncbi:hypothetical protein AQUCO_00200340v1 [Aquilegia coerulea]|uniref:Uncharacterized protein n=1 Tax=Aquilegia coerulea TaxID=218851 RepID=A0A2G5F2Z3_AQUCA|nr:hypothetical protein AQUCO_00200340v1 [Aquilegia coerulea]
MAKHLPTVYIIFVLLALISVEHMVLKVNAKICRDFLGDCKTGGDAACDKKCHDKYQGIQVTGKCFYLFVLTFCRCDYECP